MHAGGVAAPKIAGQRLLNVCLSGRLRLGAQQRVHGHHKARRAEAALGPMRQSEPLLHWVQPIAHISNPCTAILA